MSTNSQMFRYVIQEHFLSPRRVSHSGGAYNYTHGGNA